ncbi:SAM-dependent methyltransferase [Candidatus Pacearchaeota archaeon]|nr:SAM-dependent methyltransferase [Candidatus Pacearchaeota archaeon]
MTIDSVKMFERIGFVKNDMNERMDHLEMMKNKSEIIIDEKYIEGLYRIEENDYLNILFLFDRIDRYELKSQNYDGEVRGVFSSRSPFRPSRIGTTTVKLLSRDKNKLIVEGLDALNDTPVLDIKPFVPVFDDSKLQEISLNRDKNSPRKKLTELIKKGDNVSLLLESGKLHGHFCLGLALGVMASSYAMKELALTNSGMEEVIVITETNNCMSDGVQFVTGCTFGNNALIFKDLGKSAFTLARRNGEGLRVTVKNNFRDKLSNNSQEFFGLFEKIVKNRQGTDEEKMKFKMLSQKASFDLLGVPFEDVFNVKRVNVEIPKFAPIHDSIICEKCSENTMSTRTKGNLCLECSGSKIMELNGSGIVSLE